MFPHNDEGRSEILTVYDLADLSEIADHGCQSGVCSEHIYYADTIAFFDKYEGEILDLIHIRYGTDELVSIFKRSEADYDMYRNECTWLFIENVAQDHIMELEQMEEDQDAMISSYLEPVNKLAEDFKALGYNHPGTMTESRYANA